MSRKERPKSFDFTLLKRRKDERRSPLGGQWKEKEKVLMLKCQWKENKKVLMLRGQWKEKEKVLFCLFPLPPKQLYLDLYLRY
jgi:hypothetical protein